MRALALAAVLLSPTPPGVSIAFPDALHGWAAGRGGIVATRDGGRSWSLQRRSAATALSAVDPRRAWALAPGGALLRTTDGRHWRRLGKTRLAALGFVSARSGFALRRDGAVLRSGDSGASWTRVSGAPRAQALCFGDARRGWLARGGTVWSTVTGGASWRRAALVVSPPVPPIPELACRKRTAWATFHGGAAAGSEGYVVFRSRGRGWRAVYAQFMRRGLPRVDAYAGPVSVVPGGGAFVEGSCGPCGRGTVSVLRPGGGRSVLRGFFPGPMAFADRRHGYLLLGSVAGRRRGVVLATRDGGQTWRTVYSARRLVPA
jgi:photosystem II stability/assembly factor-like uncharacterized protein